MTYMEQAMLNALVLSLENDAEAEKVLRLALPYFEQAHVKALIIALEAHVTENQSE